MESYEIIDLLTAAAAYDNRKASSGAVHAWSDAAERGRWNFVDALEAIKAHYAESTEYLMPAHVTQRLRDRRRDVTFQAPAIEAPDSVGQERLQELLAGAFRAIGASDDQITRRREAFARRCPTCNAAPWIHCTRDAIGGGAERASMHPARFQADSPEEVAS